MAKQGNRTASDLKGARSAWEALTQGQCNNDLPLGKGSKVLTARQVKDMAMRENAADRAERKFEKAKHVHGKDSRKLSDSWDKRNSTNVSGFFDQKKAREMKRGVA